MSIEVPPKHAQAKIKLLLTITKMFVVYNMILLKNTIDGEKSDFVNFKQKMCYKLFPS